MIKSYLPLIFCISSLLTITKIGNLPRNGDYMDVFQVPSLPIGSAGDSSLWDFREIDLENYNRIKYYSDGDTSFSIIKNKTRYDYTLKGDSLLGLGFESHLIELHDSIPSLSLVFPFSFGQKTNKDFFLLGDYSQAKNIYSIGKSDIEADAQGMILLPGGDTLRNVLRICRKNISYSKIAPKRSPIAAIDTLRDSTLLKLTETIYEWYAQGFRYPIAEARQVVNKQGSHVLAKFDDGYLCFPSEQTFLHDEENETIRENARKSQKQKPEYSSSLPLSDEDIYIVLSDEDIIVNYMHADSMDEISMTLTDLQGRVFGFIPKMKLASGNSAIGTFNRQHLIAGTYLIYVQVNENKFIKKLSIQ